MLLSVASGQGANSGLYNFLMSRVGRVVISGFGHHVSVYRK